MAAVASASCHRSSTGAVETAPDRTSIEQSYQALNPELRALKLKFSQLRKELDTLPADAPNLASRRAKLLAAEEVLGVIGGKVKWLSGELDAALRANQQQPLQTVSREIATTKKDMRELDRIDLELTHALE